MRVNRPIDKNRLGFLKPHDERNADGHHEYGGFDGENRCFHSSTLLLAPAGRNKAGGLTGKIGPATAYGGKRPESSCVPVTYAA